MPEYFVGLWPIFANIVMSGTAENALNVLTMVSSIFGASSSAPRRLVRVSSDTCSSWLNSLSSSSNIWMALVSPSLSRITSSIVRVLSSMAGRFSGDATLTGNLFSGDESLRGLLIGSEALGDCAFTGDVRLFNTEGLKLALTQEIRRIRDDRVTCSSVGMWTRVQSDSWMIIEIIGCWERYSLRSHNLSDPKRSQRTGSLEGRRSRRLLLYVWRSFLPRKCRGSQS